MKKDAFVIGIDYGTASVRSIIVNAADGTEVASSVFEYPRWKDGLYCDPAENQFRQHQLACHRKSEMSCFKRCERAEDIIYND